MKYTFLSCEATRWTQVVELSESYSIFTHICDVKGSITASESTNQRINDAVSSCWENLSDEYDIFMKMISVFSDAHKTLESCSDLLNSADNELNLMVISIESNKLTIAHCGDCHCSLIRNDKVLYDSHDNMPPRVHPYQPTISFFTIEDGDRIFICSDEFYKCCHPGLLHDFVLQGKSYEEITNEIERICWDKAADTNKGMFMEL